MILAKELMVGNLVSYAGMISKVLLINGDDNATFDNVCIETKEEVECTELIHLEPIPLNEKMLEKLGLESHELGYYNLTEEITIDVEGQIRVSDDRVKPIWIAECYSVHSLMNFYFSLTGSQLTVSE